MRNPFFSAVDLICRNRWCSLHDQPVGLQATPQCAACQGRLTRVRRFEARRALVALVALALFGGLAVLGGRVRSARPPTPHPTPGPQVAVLDSAARVELTALFRSAYRDGEVTVGEREAISQVTAARRLRASDVAAFEQEIRPRITAATRRLSAAKRYVDAGRFEAAVREYRQATEIDPSDALAWAGLAAACALSGAVKEAESANQRALTLDPGNWLANYNLGLAAARRGSPEIAQEYFRRALGSLRPGGPERRAIVADLQSAPALKALRGDPHFAAFLERQSP